MLAGLAADEREVKAALIVAAYRRALASEQLGMSSWELDANTMAYAHALAKRWDAIDAAGGARLGGREVRAPRARAFARATRKHCPPSRTPRPASAGGLLASLRKTRECSRRLGRHAAGINA